MKQPTLTHYSVSKEVEEDHIDSQPFPELPIIMVAMD